MNNIATVPITLLVMATVGLSSCKNQNKTSAPAQDPQGEESVVSEYPRLYEKHFDSGQEVVGASSFILGAHPKLIKALENQFSRHLERCKPEDESTFGIQSDADALLVIRFSPNPANDTRTMMAIWKRSEKGSAGDEVLVERHSEPLDSGAEALALLKSYSSLDPQFESLAKWTVKGRGESEDAECEGGLKEFFHSVLGAVIVH